MELQVTVRSQATGSVKEVRLPLQERAFIGRGAECEIRIDGQDISRRHVGLKVAAGQITATDLSSNGSQLNGATLRNDSPQPLKPGDVLALPGWDVFIQGIDDDVLNAATAAPATAKTQPSTEAGGGMKAMVLSTIQSFPFVERVLALLSLASLAVVWMYFKS